MELSFTRVLLDAVCLVFTSGDMSNTFRGILCGDKKTGMIPVCGSLFFFCAIAGESGYDKPRILEIAEVVQNIDALDEGKKKQDKAVRKGKEAELHARKLEVSLNETR